jgi:hypothetical protein
MPTVPGDDSRRRSKKLLTLPVLRPAAFGAPDRIMPGPPWIREPFQSLELMDYLVLQKSHFRDLYPWLKPFFRDIAPGTATMGAKPSETFMKIRISIELRCRKSVFGVTD